MSVHISRRASSQDVGLNRLISFRGRYFSEQSCDSDAQGMRLVSNSSATEIRIGDFKAPCVVVLQNSSYLQCAPPKGDRVKGHVIEVYNCK